MATINLGAEHDQRLIAAVRSVLASMGGRRKGSSWGVGGSQEIAREKWRVGWRTVLLEAETYIGLTLSGPEKLIRTVAERVRGELEGA